MFKELWFFCHSLILLIFLFFIGFRVLRRYRLIYDFFILNRFRWRLIILTFWISFLIIFTIKNLIKKNYLKWLIVIIIILLSMFFICYDMFWFYIFFEFRILPVFIIIIGWGSGFKRFEAGVFLILYTLTCSLPFLGVIFFLKNRVESNFIVILYEEINWLWDIQFYLILIIFFVKLPVIGFHFWLPKAHVEAPLFGSILLAGVILKLGGYGIYTIFYSIEDFFSKCSWWIVLFGLWGRLYIGVICLFEMDLKKLVAYSSIVHIILILRGIRTFTDRGINSRILIIIRHGFCSSCLFCLVNYSYRVFKTRRVLLNKGLLNLNRKLSLIWFLICIFNLGAPPSINFFREILLINRLIRWRFLLIILLFINLIINSLYNFNLFRRIHHGNIKVNCFTINLKFIDYRLVIYHRVLLIIYIFILNLFF